MNSSLTSAVSSFTSSAFLFSAVFSSVVTAGWAFSLFSTLFSSALTSSACVSAGFVSSTTGVSGIFSSETVVPGVSVPSAAFEEPGAIIKENPSIHDTKPIDSFLVPYLGVFSAPNSFFFSMISVIFFEFFITFLSSIYSNKVLL